MTNRRMFNFDLDIIDICNKGIKKVGCVKQLDGTTLNINLYNNGEPMDLSDCVIRLFAKAPDKEPVFQKEGITYHEQVGFISIDIVDEILENVGDVIFEIEVVDLDGYIETTPEFSLHVIDKLGDDSDREIIRIKEVSVIEELKDYLEESIAYIETYKELVGEMSNDMESGLLEQVVKVQQLLEELTPKIEYETERLLEAIDEATKIEIIMENGEKERITAEINRKLKESARMQAEDARSLRESDRIKMEAFREGNEILRIRLEDERVSNEEDRVFNEEERVEAEEERVDAEEERKDAELERVYEEEIRIKNEQARVALHEASEKNEPIRQENEKIREVNEALRIKSETDRIESENIRKQNEEARIIAEDKRIADDIVREQTVKGIKDDMEVVHDKVDNLQYDTKFETSIAVKGNLYTTLDGKFPTHFGPPTKDAGNILMPYARAIGGFTKDGSGVRTIGFVAKPKDANKELDITDEMDSDAVFLGTDVSQLFLYSKERYPTIVSEGELSPLATQDWVMRLVSGLGLLNGEDDNTPVETSSVPSVFFDKALSDSWSSVPGDWMISDENKGVMLPNGVKDLYKPIIARERFNEISYIKGGEIEGGQNDVFIGLWKTTNYIYGFRMMKNTLSISYFGTNGSRGGAITFTIRETVNPGDILTLHYNFSNDIWEVYKFDDNNVPSLVYQMSKFMMSGFPEFGNGKEVSPTLSVLVNEQGGFRLADCPNPDGIRDHDRTVSYIF